ncbi:MAG: GMC family oxidoreductase [Pseudomonadota bacterium]|nr:GMC family oxidoreductase [Pseudomonadota bacterium]
MSKNIVVQGIPDLFRQGMANGWVTHNGAALEAPLALDCDVLVIGTGAGGGTAAEIFAQQGLKVIMLEEGPLQTSNDFDMQEKKAYSSLYQEGLTRGTADGGFTIMQGRAVGGSTTVNWTASFRTPDQTLDHWTRVHGLKGFSKEEMAPWFEKMEQRLHISKWNMVPNANNSVIAKGCDKLGYDWAIIPRNVNGCWNLGYCGTGCPTNAKQSMLVTTIPAALELGAELLYRARADQLIIDGDQVKGVRGHGLADNGIDRTQTFTVTARHTVMACGGINGPGLLLRSNAPDPHQRIGKRTFLHPVPATLGDFPERIDGYYGAPQSVYSDHFQWRNGTTGPAGFKLEVPPLQPGFVASIGMLHGQAHSDQMNRLPYLNMMIALLRDGFVEESQGGEIFLRDDGIPGIHYEINDYLREGIVRAWKTMTEIQFAAGAKAVRPVHSQSRYVSTLKEALQQADSLNLDINKMRVGSAHVMGGCGMGEDPQSSVVDSLGKFHHLDGLHIMDGSTFPTSIGANPQLSIYGMVAKQATALAQALKG